MIPSMCYPIASRYNIILVLLFRNFNIIFFPLVIAPCIASSRHKIIIIVCFVDNNYWVQVKLKLNFPLPPVIDRWRQNCNEIVRAWESTYVGNMSDVLGTRMKKLGNRHNLFCNHILTLLHHMYMFYQV